MWGCWAASTVTAFVAVLQGARNMPIQEDWHVIRAASGVQDHFWSWLWAQNNEHRVPLPKLLYVGLLRLWTDFRVGMVCTMLLLAVVSALFVVVAGGLRGRTRWTDAFFPLVFLHLGHWENFTWSWQLQFVTATALAAGVLLLVASGRPVTTTRRALALGACLVAIPLTGATALPFAPAMALVVLWDAYRASGEQRATRAVLWGSGGLALALTALYFVGLQRPSWVPPSPSPASSIRTGIEALALSFGPAAGSWWFVSGLVALFVFGAAAYLLFKARAWHLLVFLGAACALALFIGNGRAGLVATYGMPDRYAIIAVPGLCCAYLAFDRYGWGRWARYGPALLCGGMAVLYPFNAHVGMQFRDWYHQRLDPFSADVANGVPIEELTYYRPIAAFPDVMRESMLLLHRQGVGVFAHLRETPTGSRATRWIDGLDEESPDWVSVGTAGTATVVSSPDGRRHVSWHFDVTKTWAAVGLTFPQVQDWRGMGSFEVSYSGQGSGHAIRIRLGLVDASGATDRYDSLFVDDTPGPQTVIIPWNGFGHVDADGDFDIEGPLPLERVASVTFIAMEPGAGTITFHRVGLVPGHGQIGWPFHPAAERRSLPPWR